MAVILTNGIFFMDKKYQIDFYFFLLLSIIVFFFSYLLHLIYPYVIADADSYSWFEYAKNFNIYDHTIHESFRRLPFGLILVFATNFTSPGTFIFSLQVLLFTLCICAFYELTKDLFAYRWLRMFVTLVLLAITILMQKLFFFNLLLLPQATSSFFYFFGAVLVLIGFFRFKDNIYIFGCLILGIGAFSQGMAVMILPAWLFFLFYSYRRLMNLSSFFLSLLLLIAPSIFYEIRTIYIGGELWGPKFSDYLLARTLPLVSDQDLLVSNKEINNKIIDTLRSFENNSEGFKSDPYDTYLLALANYSLPEAPTWQELLVQSKGLENSQTAYKKSAQALSFKIISLHTKLYFSMIFNRYVEMFDNWSDCGLKIETDPKERYRFLYTDPVTVEKIKRTFYNKKENLTVLNSNESLARALKSSCRYLPKINSAIGNLFYVSILHSFMILFVFLILTFSSPVMLIKSPINIKNCLLVYSLFMLTVVPPFFLTSAMHVVFEKHGVAYELLIHASVVILLTLIVYSAFFILKNTLYKLGKLFRNIMISKA